MTGGAVSLNLQTPNVNQPSSANAENSAGTNSQDFQKALKSETEKSGEKSMQVKKTNGSSEKETEPLVDLAQQGQNILLAMVQNQMVYNDFLMQNGSNVLTPELLTFTAENMQPITEGTTSVVQSLPLLNAESLHRDLPSDGFVIQNTEAVSVSQGMKDGQPKNIAVTQEGQMTEKMAEQVVSQSIVTGDKIQQTTQSKTENQVVLEQNEPQKSDDFVLPQEGIGLQTVQKTTQGDVIQVQVSDGSLVNTEDTVNRLADKIIMRSSNEFDLQLEPEELGKMHIKLIFENGETKVSILCTTQQAMDALANNTDKLAAVLENRTGNAVFVQVESKEEPFYQNGQQENPGQQERNSHEERRNHQQQKKIDDPVDFLEQLRLGLV